MSHSTPLVRRRAVVGIVALAVVGLPLTALSKTYKSDCTKSNDLQKIIDSAANGDTIEISGICMGNIVIRDKGLTLIGTGPGPNGITGTAANTDGVRIESSRGTHFEGLVISNPLFTGMRIRFHSQVTMTDCEVSGSSGGAATGIWVQEGSAFDGLRLRLDNNLRGLGAVQHARAFCRECDLNGNASFAATATQNAVLSLLDSAVSGNRGINAIEHSYIDIDCLSHVSAHACSLSAANLAGLASGQSTVVFYDAGDFNGRFLAADRSRVHLFGARQQSNPGANLVDDGSSLRVEPFSSDSRLMGHTDVTGFSNALFYGAGTELDGSLSCDGGGDAWVEPGIDQSGFTIAGCDHAP